jgi:hypothetical protein
MHSRSSVASDDRKRDVEDVFRQEMPDCHVVAVTSIDKLTGAFDLAYIVTRSGDGLRRLGRLRLETRVCG